MAIFTAFYDIFVFYKKMKKYVISFGDIANYGIIQYNLVIKENIYEQS